MNVSPCIPCCSTPQIVDVPGSPGLAGADGAAGVNAFTTTISTITIVNPGDTFTGIQVVDASWIAIGQTIFISDGTEWGTFTVTNVVGNLLDLTYLGAPGDTPGVIAAGALVTPTGTPGALAAPLPNAITDNSTGTASDIIAVGAAVHTLSVHFRAAAITGNVLVFTYVPGYKFKILKISASVVDAISTGGKAATLTTAIAGTPTTGGIVIMSGTYALGATQASSAAVTGANTGSAADAITVTASSVTAFSEGGFELEFKLQNMDTADAIASLSKHVNDLITSLT